MAIAKKPARRKGDAITIDEVASRAKVSPMTVSRVINGNDNVRDSTRERVMRAVQELGYTPNLAASSLAAAKPTRVALIYSNSSEAYLCELLLGVLHGTARTAVQLVIEAWDDLSPEAMRTSVRALARSVAGVILPPPLCESKVAVSELVDAGVPLVAIATGEGSGDDIPRVRIDDFTAAREITRLLIDQGHRRIGHITGHSRLSASARRLEGYQAALDEAGIARDRHLVQQGYFTYRSGLDAAEKLLTRQQRPTAIFAANDDMAAAVISVAHRCNLDVPRDLSVVGFDDTSAATTVWPELTTVRQPIVSMADLAVDMLMRSIRNQKRDAHTVLDHVVSHTLVRRDSVAPPPEAAT